MLTESVERSWSSTLPLDVSTSVSIIGRGARDSLVRSSAAGTWYCAETPDGAVTCHLEQRDDRTVHATAWGPGAAWQIEHLPELLGEDTSAELVEPTPGLVAEARRRNLGLRVPRTGRIMTALAMATLEQRVVGLDALAARQRLLNTCGSTPPGPAPEGMRIPPAPDEWARIPSWEWHRAGVDPARSRTIVAASQRAARVGSLVNLPPSQARTKLQALPGVGPWTAAETSKVALGDTDAVSVGDYHLAHLIVWSFTGQHGGDDAAMLELLEPYRPYRQLVVRLVELSVRMPRRGPRTARVDHRRN